MNILFFLLLSVIFSLDFAQICSTVSDPFPMDITKLINSQYLDLAIYSFKENDKTFQVQITKGNKSLAFTGDFGSVIFNGNLHFAYKETTMTHIYNCTNLTLYYESINLYWGGKPSALELIIGCTKYSSNDTINSFNLMNKIYISIPVINMDISQDDDKRFFTDIQKSGFNGTTTLPFNFTISDFSYDSNFFDTSILNQDTQIYFQNGNDFLNCSNQNQITLIIFNSFLPISDTLLEYYKSLYEELDIKTNLTDYFNKKIQNNEMLIYRNFHFNENFENFEKVLIEFGESAWFTRINILSITILLFLL